jgi:ketosteroid isomerase-like protein
VRLYDRFAAIMDATDFEGLEHVLAADVTFEGWDPTPWHGLATVIRRFREMDKHIASHRMITNHRIELSGDRARAIAHYRSAHINPADGGGQTEHAHEGWYLTSVARRAAGWRFTHVKHITLASAVNTSEAGRATIQEIYRSIPW